MVAPVGDEDAVEAVKVIQVEGAGAQIVNRHAVRAHDAAGARVGGVAVVISGVGTGGVEDNIAAAHSAQQITGNTFRHRRAADVAHADH
ncbi:Uncharacterised protein [Cardiobacterium valvarum]|uniref:Uncharacterized protein n=1 Tax=Cardiobacterium valvarum TaxID=194702 RepID=A0A381EFS1_9GAMM|nr:Uncharacterised protein [Cardiobacterium valvarum]